MRGRYTIDVHLDADDIQAALRSDVIAGLTTPPRQLPPKWFYDDLGSRLFDAITVVPEYYPTRCETEILLERAVAIGADLEADTLIELGSGTSTKTRILLDALGAGAKLRRFIAFDVSETTLRTAATALTDRYPGLAVHALVGDFEHHLVKLPEGDHRLVALLGGTIGNLDPPSRAVFLDDLASVLAPGEGLLLGTDLVKSPDALLSAYDDPTGVTAAFNRNVLNVLNRRLDGDFQPRQFAHVATWNDDQQWIEMHLRSERDQRARLRSLDLELDLSLGETIRTEISAKFTRAGVTDELSRAGFVVQRWWTDANANFALSLSVRQ